MSSMAEKSPDRERERLRLSAPSHDGRSSHDVENESETKLSPRMFSPRADADIIRRSNVMSAVARAARQFEEHETRQEEPPKFPATAPARERQEPSPPSAPPADTDSLLIGYRPDIDGLRGFGAFLVLWFHFEETWNESAYKGADLTNSTFFAVSGFVVSLTVLKARARRPFEFTATNNIGFAVLFLMRRYAVTK